MDANSRFDRIHLRCVEQASWTAEIRGRLLPFSILPPGSRLLEIGAGTGAVVGPMAEAHASMAFHALDLDPDVTRAGALRYPGLRWQIGDAHALPLRSGAYDAVFFHYVLLWLEDPPSALREAARVTRPGGLVLAFAEPDHASRIDYPDSLAPWGERQTRALAEHGADIAIGRRLRSLFAGAGLEPVASGIVGAEWTGVSASEGSRLERETWRADLAGTVSEAELDEAENLEKAAWKRGERVLFVPTFFAAGRVR
ncbi:MAG TPA: methyltransferase domain-containing protein [Anaerolineales bacterium]|nr:methyltransferase domain-containing protein [Anaerolineales bacterium]